MAYSKRQIESARGWYINCYPKKKPAGWYQMSQADRLSVWYPRKQFYRVSYQSALELKKKWSRWYKVEIIRRP